MDIFLATYFFFLDNPKYFFIGVAISLSAIVLSWGRWGLSSEHTMGEGLALILRKAIVTAAGVYCFFFPFLLMISSELFFDGAHNAYWEENFRQGMVQSVKLVALAVVTSALLRLVLAREVAPYVSGLLRRFRVKQTGASLSDIRSEQGRFKSASFKPEKYYDAGSFFLGLDSAGKPIRLPEAEWRSYNQKIIGPTQTGKGVLIGVQLDQAIRKGYTTIFIDPKPDRHARAIMQRACLESGRAFIELDLNEESAFSWEPFQQGKPRDRKTRLYSVLGVGETGTDADYYKQLEREALDEIFNKWDGSIYHLLKLASGDERATRTRNILRELLDLPSIGGDKAPLRIDELLTSGAVLYVRSSTKDITVTRATKALIQEIVQTSMVLNESRKTHLFLCIDEVRFFISDVLADSLATIAGFDANISITYQSIMDLLNLKDKNLNSKAIADAIDINCKFTLAYAAGNPETAEWMALKSGTIMKQTVDRERVETNSSGGDSFSGQAFIKNEEQALITENMALVLPSRVGVLYLPHRLAQILYTSWISIDLDKYKSAAPSPSPAETPEMKESEPASVEQKSAATSPQSQKQPRRKKDMPTELTLSDLERKLAEATTETSEPGFIEDLFDDKG